MIRLELNNCNLMLTEKPEKYQHYNQEKLINTNVLQVKKYCLLIKDKTYMYIYIYIYIYIYREREREREREIDRSIDR